MGEQVFARANCASCHAGADGTNHRIIPAPEIGTEPTRARAFAKLEPLLVPPRIQSFSAVSPVPADAPAQDVPVPEPDQVQLAYALGGSPGGYKVPNLVGLRWRAPYLHDGGVAVGRDPEHAVGLPGTLGRGEMPDAANSLRALVGRQLRERVIAANAADPATASVHDTGAGHPFWVDAAAGFNPEEQAALVAYLLDLTPPSAR